MPWDLEVQPEELEMMLLVKSGESYFQELDTTLECLLAAAHLVFAQWQR